MASTLAQERKEEQSAADLEADLRHLEALQEQLDQLRGALPSIVGPLRQPGISSQERFLWLKKAAIQASIDVKALTESWTSEHTQRILSRADESLQHDADLSKAAQMPRYGWNQTK